MTDAIRVEVVSEGPYSVAKCADCGWSGLVRWLRSNAEKDCEVHRRYATQHDHQGQEGQVAE